VTHWKPYFPFSDVRKEQSEAIDFAIDAYSKGKKVVVLELGTGVGKSAIAMTLARYYHGQFMESSYVLTTQKLLQEQYMHDFAISGLKLLKSATSYTCQMFDGCDQKTTCHDIQKVLKSKSDARNQFLMCQGPDCRYAQARQEFYDASEGITNYAYFLATNAYAYQKVPSRQLLILDEGHNIESAVSSFVALSFSNRFYKDTINVKKPPADATQEQVFNWLTETCLKKLRKVIGERKKRLESTDKSSPDVVEQTRSIEELERYQKRIEYFKRTYEPEGWVLDVSRSDKRGERIYEFKPLDVSGAVRRLVLDQADKILVLSATIIDINVFCRSIGVTQGEVAYLRLPSPFPAENRPIHYIPVGSMSKKCIDSTMPVMISTVQEILRQHPNDKGIIHCVNYRIARAIKDQLGDKRLMLHESFDRDDVLKAHCESSDPTVLLSPSMTEGVDLAGDRSRFQVICKVPFPFLGDVSVKRRLEKDKDWYAYQTVKTIVQALGRSIRNEKDHAVSYILDADWERFYRMNSSMFPPDFSALLV
jgi:ATP-dependent DNA helicase DinG